MTHGIDCNCSECKAVKKLLIKLEKEGKIYISATKEDKKKLRSVLK